MALFGHAYVLSRIIANQKPESEDAIITTVSQEEDINKKLHVAIQATYLFADDIKYSTQKDDGPKYNINWFIYRWPIHKYSETLDSLLTDGVLHHSSSGA